MGMILGTDSKPLAADTAYRGASFTEREIASWLPSLGSADAELSDERSMLIGKVNRHAFLEGTVIAVTHVEPYEVAARRLQIEMALMKLSAFPKVILGGDFNTSDAKQIAEGYGYLVP